MKKPLIFRHVVAGLVVVMPMLASGATPVAYIATIERGKLVCEQYTGERSLPNRLAEQDRLFAGDMMRCRGGYNKSATVRFVATTGTLIVPGSGIWYGIGNPAPAPVNSKSNNVPSPGEEGPLGRFGQLFYVPNPGDRGSEWARSIATGPTDAALLEYVYQDSGTSVSPTYGTKTSRSVLAQYLSDAITRGAGITSWDSAKNPQRKSKDDYEKMVSEREHQKEKDELLLGQLEAQFRTKGIDFKNLDIQVLNGNVSFVGDTPQFVSVMSVVKDVAGVRSVIQRTEVATGRLPPSLRNLLGKPEGS